MTRTIYCAYPRRVDAEACERLASDIAERVSAVARTPISATLVPYETVTGAIESLSALDSTGMALFILNDEPAAYYDASYGLARWRVKRVTETTLSRYYTGLLAGVRDRHTGHVNTAQGQRQWDRFILTNALDVLQLLDIVPFRIDQAGPYDAQLVIDVGHDRRHFALSLLIARPEGLSPAFHISSHVHVKTDPQHDEINRIALADEIVQLIDTVLHPGSDPLGSLLVLRDGQLRGREGEGVDDAVQRLVQRGKLVADSRVDLADIHKDALTPIRMWEIDATGAVHNPLEGTLVWLNVKTVLVAATGEATQTQGTAEPWVVSGNGRCPDVVNLARSAYAGAHLNWSSPNVAQRLPLALKRTDGRPWRSSPLCAIALTAWTKRAISDSRRCLCSPSSATRPRNTADDFALAH